MANNDPHIEKLTIWGYTQEEVDRRWKVAERFHVVNRLFGGSSPSDTTAESPPEATLNDNPHIERFLEHMLTEGEGL